VGLGVGVVVVGRRRPERRGRPHPPRSGDRVSGSRGRPSDTTVDAATGPVRHPPRASRSGAASGRRAVDRGTVRGSGDGIERPRRHPRVPPSRPPAPTPRGALRDPLSHPPSPGVIGPRPRRSGRSRSAPGRRGSARRLARRSGRPVRSRASTSPSVVRSSGRRFERPRGSLVGVVAAVGPLVGGSRRRVGAARRRRPNTRRGSRRRPTGPKRPDSASADSRSKRRSTRACVADPDRGRERVGHGRRAVADPSGSPGGETATPATTHSGVEAGSRTDGRAHTPASRGETGASPADRENYELVFRFPSVVAGTRKPHFAIQN
jgi:hypothetical protein